jgi:hypothetical protein
LPQSDFGFSRMTLVERHACQKNGLFSVFTQPPIGDRGDRT